MFEDFMSSMNPEIGKDSPAHDKMRESFFTGARAIVALAGVAAAPSYPGEKPSVKRLASVLERVDNETYSFLHPAPPDEARIM
jgi:hypothetical protein